MRPPFTANRHEFYFAKESREKLVGSRTVELARVYPNFVHDDDLQRPRLSLIVGDADRRNPKSRMRVSVTFRPDLRFDFQFLTLTSGGSQVF